MAKMRHMTRQNNKQRIAHGVVHKQQKQNEIKTTAAAIFRTVYFEILKHKNKLTEKKNKFQKKKQKKWIVVIIARRKPKLVIMCWCCLLAKTQEKCRKWKDKQNDKCVLKRHQTSNERRGTNTNCERKSEIASCVCACMRTYVECVRKLCIIAHF